ncbi:hypothetical protein ACFL50_04035 [Candidatus Latescibacterota bacterium]
MKRRDVISNVTSVLLGSVFVGCAAIQELNENTDQQSFGSGSGTRPSSGSRSTGIRSAPADLNSLSDILQRARCPLSDGQINTLQKFRTPEEFKSNLSSVLTNEQLEAVKNSSGRGGRGGGGRRR